MKHILYNQKNCQLDSPYGEIKFVLQRKNVRNLNLRIRKDLTVIVSANNRIKEDTIYSFVLKNVGWIRRTAEKLKQKISVVEKAQTNEIFLLGKKYYINVIKGLEEKAVISCGKLQIIQKNPLDTEKTKILTAIFYKKTGEKIFSKLCRKWLKNTAVKAPIALQIRNMKSRWGTCNPAKKKITLNLKLLHFSLPASDYVVLHEILHFFHKGHGKDFYKALSDFMPDYRQREAILKNPANQCSY